MTSIKMVQERCLLVERINETVVGVTKPTNWGYVRFSKNEQLENKSVLLTEACFTGNIIVFNGTTLYKVYEQDIVAIANGNE